MLCVGTYLTTLTADIFTRSSTLSVALSKMNGHAVKIFLSVLIARSILECPGKFNAILNNSLTEYYEKVQANTI